ncbi:MAG: IS630 family transposase [Candidatus Thiodiazotropha taylori]
MREAFLQQPRKRKRKQAVRLRKQGMTYAQIANSVGVHERTVIRWIDACKSEGVKALKAQPLGRPMGAGRALSQTQEKAIQKLIADKTPDQLKMAYALWTREAVKELIEQEFSIKLAIRTVGKYLSLWGFTPQKPLNKAYEQNPKKVTEWLENTYPEIQARAKAEKAEIYWGDETGIRNDSQHERGYAPKGHTPVVRLNANRTSTNMLSAITNQGKVRFKVFDGSMNADILIDFMKRLIKGAKKKIFLILDNLRVHHAKVVKTWLEDRTEEIEVFYLPVYSPELNPDEYLNCDLKQGVHSGKPARSKAQLKKKVTSHMRMLQRKAARVKKYFEYL